MIFIPAENVIHVFEPSRAGMYRGVSFLHACVNDLHDMDDLQQMVMQVCKQAASIGNVTTNKTGEFDPAASRRAAMKIQSFNQSGAAVTKTTDNFYNVKLGSQEIALMHGDDITRLSNAGGMLDSAERRGLRAGIRVAATGGNMDFRSMNRRPRQ